MVVPSSLGYGSVEVTPQQGRLLTLTEECCRPVLLGLFVGPREVPSPSGPDLPTNDDLRDGKRVKPEGEDLGSEP